MVSRIIATLVVGLLVATSAVARDLSYNFVRLDFVNLEIDAGATDVPGFGSVDDDGLGLGAGVRHLITDNFEFSGRLNYMDVFDFDTSLEVRGDYYLFDNWVIGAGLESGDDVTTWLIGGRYNFAGFGK